MIAAHILISVAVATTGSGSDQEPRSDLIIVRAGWEHRRRALTTARYAITTASTPASPHSGRKNPGRPTSGSLTLQFDFEGNRLRTDWKLTLTDPTGREQ